MATGKYVRTGYTVEGLAGYLGVRPATVRRLIAAGELEAHRLSERCLVLLPGAINEFLDRTRTTRLRKGMEARRLREDSGGCQDVE